MLPGGRDRPPYNARQTAGKTGNFAFVADVSFPGAHLRWIVGRAFTPAARPSGNRGVSGPMKTIGPYAVRPGGKDPCVGDDACIVPQSCRPPQCLGCTFNFSRSLPSAAMLPGGRDRPPYNARQTAGGIKTPLCGKGHFTGICSRFWHLFPADRRAGVHARRETFRLPWRFRADEITAARRRRFGGSPARSAGVRAGDQPLRSTSRSAPALRGGRPNPRFHPLTPIRREVHPARPGRYPAVNRRRSPCQTSSA